MGKVSRFCLVWIVVISVSAQAQNIEKVLPKNVPQSEKSQALEEPRPSAESGDGEVILEKLKGIKFVSGKNVQKDGVPVFKGVQAEGFPFLQEQKFQKIIEKAFLDKPLTKGALRQIPMFVNICYVEKGFPLVVANVPEQNISNGVIQVAVQEGRVGNVKTEGNKWFSSNIIFEGVDLHKGDQFEAGQVSKNVDFLNQNPFHSTSVLLAQGSEVGTTDVILKTQDRFPLRVYAGFENNGNAVTGTDRWEYGFNYGNLFGLDQQFSYQFTTSDDYDSYRSHGFSYIVPLPWHHTITVFGAYIDSVGNATGVLSKGNSWQTSVRYTAGLPTIGKVYKQAVNVGYDYKESNNNLDFGGTNVFASATAVSQFEIGYNGSLQDSLGITSIGANLYLSPSDSISGNNNRDFNASRAGAHSDYVYGQLQLARITRLPEDFTWHIRGTYQAASTNLLASEQLSLGGAGTVRGYAENAANGDTGWLITNEIHTPGFSIPGIFDKKVGSEIVKDNLEFLGFVDYGWVRNNNLLAGERSNTFLLSAGPGVRYTINQYVSFRCDYGFQLSDSGLNDKSASRGQIAMTISY